jgi:prepilin-type processing-associated H-X9-DG protein
MKHSSATEESAFSRVELAVVLAVAAILAALLIPMTSRARAQAQWTQCMNNHRQLILAWRLYVAQSKDDLPSAKGGPYAWMNGWMDYSPGNRANWDPTADIMQSPLWPFCHSNAGLFKCPSDPSVARVGPSQVRTLLQVGGVQLQLVAGGSTNAPRIRSVSMLNWVGGRCGPDGAPDDMGYSNTRHGTTSGEYRTYYRASDMVTPGPARTFVFVDERMDSINDGMFVTDMLTYPAATEDICDLPAQYHDGAANFSYADGHAEVKKWTTPLLLAAPSAVTIQPFPTDLNGFSPDAFWLMDHATRLIP